MAVVAVLAALGLLARSDASAGAAKLPDGFIVGAGTSAYQAEGAWNVSGELKF